jgi:hypothetical protein
VAFDPNRAGNETSARFQKHVNDQHKAWVDETHRRRGTGGEKQGGLAGFLIVVAIIAIAAFWIASQQS